MPKDDDMPHSLKELVEEGKISPSTATALKDEKEIVAKLEFCSAESFSGLLPPPDVLRMYEDIHPGTAKIFLEMLQGESRARQCCAINASRSAILGQIMAGLVAVVGFIAAVFLAKEGFRGASIAAVLAGLGVIVSSIIGAKLTDSSPDEEQGKVRREE